MGSRRRSLRRAVALDCAIAMDYWDRSVPLRTWDVSNEGLYLDTLHPFHIGDEVVLALTPPGARPFEDVWGVAEVTRLSSRTGLGLTFTYLNAVDRRFLARSLVGHPPRLPKKPPPLPRQLTRADVTFLDHDELQFAPRSLSALLTGARPSQRLRAALR